MYISLTWPNQVNYFIRKILSNNKQPAKIEKNKNNWISNHQKKIIKKIKMSLKKNQTEKIINSFKFPLCINFYKIKKLNVKSRCLNMDPRQVKAGFYFNPIPFCTTWSTIFEQLHVHGTLSTAKLRGWPGILHINEGHQRA